MQALEGITIHPVFHTRLSVQCSTSCPCNTAGTRTLRPPNLATYGNTAGDVTKFLCRVEEAFYATYTARALGKPEAAGEVPSCRIASEAVHALSQSLEAVYFATKLAGMAG